MYSQLECSEFIPKRKTLASSIIHGQAGNADLTQLGETLPIIPIVSLKVHSSKKRRLDNYFSDHCLAGMTITHRHSLQGLCFLIVLNLLFHW